MSRVNGVPTNYRVVVEPRRLGSMGFISMSDEMAYGSPEKVASAYADRCRDIADAIRRHVDDVADVVIEFDTNQVCEHCGERWYERSESYNGGCCEKDQEAEDSRAASEAGGAA